MSAPALEAFLDKVSARRAVVGVIGLGYVGLPLARLFSERGFPVLGFDIEPEKVAALHRGESYIGHIPPAAIAQMRAAGFAATTDMSRAGEADALVICVPTPLDAHHQPDLSFVLGTMDALAPRLRAGQLVALESTTYPGTTREELLPRIEKRGLVVGRDVFLVFSPEREDPANAKFDTRTIPKVCGGVTDACQRAGLALYGAVIERTVPVSSPEAAEMTKLLENIHRSVNIGLVNEIKIVCDRMGIDVLEVIDAAATKPFGFTPYYPGPGVGGHCIPVDPFYLTWKAKEFGVHTRFIELAGEINGSMPDWVVGKVTDALNARRKALHGARVLLLGLAYKKDVDDVRESPAVEILTRLVDRGAQASYSDPHVPVFPRMRRHSFDLTSTPLTPQTLSSFDCVVLATDHQKFDYAMIREHAALIVDTRGVFRDRKNDKVVRGVKTRIALVGCGRISASHFEAIAQAAPEAELTAVCDADPRALEKATSATGARGYASLGAMLKEAPSDLLAVCTPSGLHAEHSVIGLEAGRHVICEKPMATRLADAQRMGEAAARSGRELFVVLQNRFNSTLLMLKRAIDGGRFGRIHMVTINVFWNRPQSYYDLAPWRGTRALDGGALLNQASHYADLVPWLFGPVREVHAFTATQARRIEMEDSGVVGFQWANGAMGTLNVTMLTYKRNLEGSLTVLGERGTAQLGGLALNEIRAWEFEEARPEDAEIGKASYETTSVYGRGHLAYYRNAMARLRGQAVEIARARDGLESLAFIDAAYRSAAGHERVRVS